jgi:hypothetical protein
VKRIVFFAGAVALATLAAIWAISGPSSKDLPWENQVFRDVPMTILEAGRFVPFFGRGPPTCEYALVELSPEATERPPERDGQWQHGPAIWYRPDSHSDNDDLFLCGLGKFPDELKRTLTALSSDPSTWWLDNERGGYLYSKEKRRAFYFHLID